MRFLTIVLATCFIAIPANAEGVQIKDMKVIFHIDQVLSNGKKASYAKKLAPGFEKTFLSLADSAWDCAASGNWDKIELSCSLGDVIATYHTDCLIVDGASIHLEEAKVITTTDIHITCESNTSP
jgi:hypothetical protein